MLAAAEQEGADELWCLGDLVGYNADPEACTGAVIEVSDICLAGNHDLVVNGIVDMQRVRARCRGGRALGAADAVSAEALEQLRALAAERRAGTASSCTTPARATRSGST